MFIRLHNQYKTRTSIAFIALMLLSVLQFCMMSMSEAQGIEEQTSQHSQSASEMNHSESMSHSMVENENAHAENHDCCLFMNMEHDANLSSACPDCDSDDPIVKTEKSELQPNFLLLYSVALTLFNQNTELNLWRDFIDVDTLLSQPKIYLKKASFLE